MQLFGEFVSLPNLHANYHLLRHAKTFGTLTNIEVGVKEMFHKVFKNLVPHTNRKNIDLDLLKRYTTLQSIRHLADGGIDPRNLQSSIDFVNRSQDSKRLFKDWFIMDMMENSEMDNDESEGNNNNIFLCCCNISC